MASIERLHAAAVARRADMSDFPPPMANLMGISSFRARAQFAVMGLKIDGPAVDY